MSNNIALHCNDLQSVMSNIAKRGGACMVQCGADVYIFGGADRGQNSYNDLWKISADMKNVTEVSTSGYIPSPRSDSSIVAFGDRYLFLFGGMNAELDEAYNDLYSLDLESNEWIYIGEKGEEIQTRRGHSLAIVNGNNNTQYLVVFGGCDFDGTCSNATYYASLPDRQTVIDELFFVEWKILEGSTQPPRREMHSSCMYNDSLLITGGISIDSHIDGGLSDIWILRASLGSNEVPITWYRSSVDLPSKLYGHCSAVCVGSGRSSCWLCVKGGVSDGNAVIEELTTLDISTVFSFSGQVENGTAFSKPSWLFKPLKTDTLTVGFRVGQVMLSLPTFTSTAQEDVQASGVTAAEEETDCVPDGVSATVEDTMENFEVQREEMQAKPSRNALKKKRQRDRRKLLNNSKECGPLIGKLLLFGGADQNKDYNDLFEVSVFESRNESQTSNDPAGICTVLC